MSGAVVEKGTDVAEAADPEASVPAPWWARIVVVVVLGLLVVAFFKPVKFTFWPITSWQLFSGIRTAEQSDWLITSVAEDGTETRIPFEDMGPDQQRWLLVARSLPSRSDAARLTICRGWADVAREELGAEAVTEVRVYRVVRRAADRIQEPPEIVEQDLYLECAPA